MQSKVIKADGNVEEYLHTKVMGVISNALSIIDEGDVHISEELANVVTYYLYHKQKRRCVPSSEIFSIIKVVLTATGYEEAAAMLTEHFFERKLKRSRIEVASVDIRRLSDAQILCKLESSWETSRWDKSRIVTHLVATHDICRQTARTIASMVEEKIFNIGLTLIPASLVRQIVLGDTAAVLRAEKQLEAV